MPETGVVILKLIALSDINLPDMSMPPRCGRFPSCFCVSALVSTFSSASVSWLFVLICVSSCTGFWFCSIPGVWVALPFITGGWLPSCCETPCGISPFCGGCMSWLFISTSVAASSVSLVSSCTWFGLPPIPTPKPPNDIL